jgi:AICAR transformylase/IMP cyclohydrolase PurH
MTELKKVQRALVSVYFKEPSRRLIEVLNQLDVELVSTGGTLE